MSARPGTLYLCATPIGNLGDITGRVLDTLKEADIIACEDTRNSRKLFSHFGIAVTPLSREQPYFENPSETNQKHTEFEPGFFLKGKARHRIYITSYHDHNRYDKARELADYLHRGFDIALVTDAGMPAISDPGYELVALCREEGIPVTALPGACALVTALALSGISPRRFVFEGFLPDKKERAHVLGMLRAEERTIILYEAPHHLKKTLCDLENILGGGRRLALCRELTKKFEEVRCMTVEEAIALYKEQDPRGEYVLVIEGKNPSALLDEKRKSFEELSLSDHVRMYEEQGLDRKEAMKRVAADRGLAKRDVYNALLKL